MKENVKGLMDKKIGKLKRFQIIHTNPYSTAFGKVFADRVDNDVKDIIGKPDFYIGFKLSTNFNRAFMAVSIKGNGAFAVTTLKPVLIKHETDVRDIKENEDREFQELLTPIFNEIFEGLGI